MKFKPGDKVICVENSNYPEIANVMRGSAYIVKGYTTAIGMPEVLLFETGENGWAESRFIVYEPLLCNEYPKPLKLGLKIEKSMTLPTDSNDRKNYPLFRGLLRYFPAALAGVARTSKLGNDKHNPGEEMHHARSKSADQGDCILRHLVDVEDLLAALNRGDSKVTKEDVLNEINQMTWRALAFSQELHEKFGAPLAPGAKK